MTVPLLGRDPGEGSAAGRSAGPNPGGVEISTYSLGTLPASLRSEWEALFQRQEEPGNPFTAPVWVTEWYQHYTKSSRQQRIVFVREHGQLVGVGPFYLSRIAVGPVPLANRWLLVGAGQPSSPIEAPGMLCAAGAARRVTRAVVESLLRDETEAWSEITLPRGLGWFEPDWIYGLGNDCAFYRHQLSRACVMLPLATTWEDTRARFKRNLKESIRRAQNRLAKDGRPWRIVHRQGGDIDGKTLGRLFELHRDRADSTRSSIKHPDAFASPDKRAFLLRTVPMAAAQGLVSVHELELDDSVVASLLVLHAPGCSYLFASGSRQDTWSLGPLTLLYVDAVKAAIGRGDSWVNFSPGPNTSKLRWSEDVWTTDDFAFGTGPRSLGLAYGAYMMLNAGRQWRDALSFGRANSSKRR